MSMVEENLFDTPEPKRRYSPSMYFPVFDPAVDGKQHQLHELVNTRRYKEASRMVAEASTIKDDRQRDMIFRTISIVWTSLIVPFVISPRTIWSNFP